MTQPSPPNLPTKLSASSNGSLLLPPNRPTRLAPNSPTPSRRSVDQSHLIDLNNLNNNSQQAGASSHDPDSVRKDSVIALSNMIKSMISQPNGTSVPGTPVMSPIGGPVPINVPMMTPFSIVQVSCTLFASNVWPFADMHSSCLSLSFSRTTLQTPGLSMGINYVQNPLYSNQIVATAALTNGAGHGTNHAIYANMINNNQLQQQQQAYMNLPGHFASACAVAASPLHGFSHFYPSTNNQVNIEGFCLWSELCN